MRYINIILSVPMIALMGWMWVVADNSAARITLGMLITVLVWAAVYPFIECRECATHGRCMPHSVCPTCGVHDCWGEACLNN